jgi:hypothetical protein
MPHTLKCLLVMLFCAVSVPSMLSGQSETASARSSFGLRFGYGLFSGDWNKVRFAPDVSMFKGGFTLGGDFDVRLGDRLTLGFDGGYEPLNGSDWEAYALSKGDAVDVNASLAYGGILVRPYLIAGERDFLRMEFGPVLLFASGSETFGGRTYNYDFFSSVKLGGQGGIEYDRRVADNIGVSLRFAGLVSPSGVSYADGETRTMIALPLTMGVRFFF